jgi:hypothetical protein
MIMWLGIHGPACSTGPSGPVCAFAGSEGPALHSCYMLWKAFFR